MKQEPILDCDNSDYMRGYSDGQAFVISTCAEFLKEDELPRERIERDHRDALALMRLLAREKIKNEALEKRLFGPTDELATRMEFESWYSEQGKWPSAVERSISGAYVLAQAQSAWVVWLAAQTQIRTALPKGCATEVDRIAPCG